MSDRPDLSRIPAAALQENAGAGAGGYVRWPNRGNLLDGYRGPAQVRRADPSLAPCPVYGEWRP